jgi:epoxide hydrolase 4
MHYLSRDDAAQGLSDKDFARLWPFFRDHGTDNHDPAWLTPALRAAHQSVWAQGLRGPCAYYQQSPLKPPTAQDRSVLDLVLPDTITHVRVATDVIWGERDRALQPCLLDGLEHYIPDLRIHRVADASHWIVHEQAHTVASLIERALAR